MRWRNPSWSFGKRWPRRLWFALAATVLAAAVCIASVPLYFPGQVPVPVFQITNRVLAIDYDGNGAEELVVGTEEGLLVLIGYQEGGQFPLLERFPLAGAATALGLLPVAGGQDTVLVVATSNPDRVVLVAYNVGDEPFSIVGQVDLEEDPGSLTIGPVGVAEQPGIVVTLPGIDRLALVADIDGVWGVQQRIDTGDRPTSVALFDVTGDGTPEIVTADSGVLSRAFSIFERDPDGSYVLTGQPAGQATPLNLCVYDQDTDEIDELFVVYADSAFISVFVAAGGVLTEQERVITPLLVDALVVAPITAGDLGLLCWTDDRGLVHYYLRQDGSWSLVETFFTGGRAGDVAPLDMNHDGYLDLAVANGATETVAMVFGNNLPSFRGYAAVHLPGTPVSGVTYDEDGNGAVDVIVACQGSRTIERLLGDGTGHLVRQPDPLVLDIEPSHLTRLNANGDAWDDLAIAESFADRVEILQGLPAGGFAPLTVVPVGDAPVVVIAADFDGDTYVDLAVANAGSDDLTLAYGAGDGTFPDVTTLPLSWSVETLCVIDLNGDPLPDLAVSAGSVGIQTITNLGGRVFGQWRFYGTGSNAVSLAAADLDGDGDQDLVVANGSDETLALLENLGSGLFSGNIRLHELDGTPYRIIAADIDLDDRTDVIVSYSGLSEVAMIINVDQWLFSPPIRFSSAQRPGTLLLADYNGDLIPDLVVFDLELDLTLSMLNVEPNPVPVQQLPLQVACGGDVLELVLVTAGLGDWRVSTLVGDAWREVATSVYRPVGRWRQSGDGWLAWLSRDDLIDLGVELDGNGPFLRLQSDGLVDGGVTVTAPAGCFTPQSATPGVSLQLSEPYPNPFNLVVRCDFSLSRAGHVRAGVWDLAGRRIATLADGWYAAGRYPLIWDGRSAERTVPAGTYLLRVITESAVVTRKTVLVK